MDEYLVPGASYNRLQYEWLKYGSLVIAYDFDNTVFDYHGKGNRYLEVIKLLRQLKRLGCHLIVFTANPNHSFIRDYLKRNDIPFDSINKQPPHFEHVSGSKIYYNALLDDRAGLIQVFEELTKAVQWQIIRRL